MSRRFAVAAFVIAGVLWAAPAEEARGDDLVHISSRVVYDVRPDQGSVRVAWDVTFQNKDPQTSSRDGSGTVFFYENMSLPVLRGASNVSAVSSTGAPLTVTLSEPGRSPTVGALVSFEEPVFYGESYVFRLAYELAGVRVQSLLVTPVYAYVPVIAGGDEAAVTVNTPSGDGWSVSVKAGECAQDGANFTCSGADAAFLAALVEVSRGDAIADAPFDVELKERTVGVTLSHLQGEDVAAQHLKELISAGLPVIEELFGFPYPASPTINVSQGGQQAVLGYEGITSCDTGGGCRVIVSPVADDVTILHELAHLWSGMHGMRWLSEGFAQLIAEEAAAALPPGLVQNQPPEREPAAVDLRLDEWGDVSSLIGAAESELEIENAGYDRSLRFLYLLRSEVGTDALKRVNAAIAADGKPADSKRYLDLVEELSGQRVDNLFGEWVFSASDRSLLPTRREARDRLQNLARIAAEEGLSEEILDAIRLDVEAWRFDTALAALSEAEDKLLEYDDLNVELSQLETATRAAGLSLPSTIEEALKEWEFAGARLMIAEADRAIEAYTFAQERVEAPRGLWKRFGLIGSDPGDDLRGASEAFAAGDFLTSLDRANDAVETMANASETALRRLLVLGLVLGVIAAGVGLAIWMSRRREEEFAEF